MTTVDEPSFDLSVEDLRPAIRRFGSMASKRVWNPFDLVDAAAIRADLLDARQIEAVRFITVVEDHLPGYVAEFHRKFPIEGDVEPSQAVFNRWLYHFFVRWAQEEDGHALALSEYQIAAGISERSELERELAAVGSRPFELPYATHAQIFAYTLLQEKVTQLYYQQLADVVREPVLRRLLRRLSQDEGRHFVFYADALLALLTNHGRPVVAQVREVIVGFQMPLAAIMSGHWRAALRAAEAVPGHDYRVAFDELVRLCRRAERVGDLTGAAELAELVGTLRAP